jgi:hypothetical protein
VSTLAIFSIHSFHALLVIKKYIRGSDNGWLLTLAADVGADDSPDGQVRAAVQRPGRAVVGDGEVHGSERGAHHAAGMCACSALNSLTLPCTGHRVNYYYMLLLLFYFIFLSETGKYLLEVSLSMF